MRRSDVAMDVAGLCTYETAALWTEAMKAAYLAPPPPGYRRITWAQLRNADRKLWQLVASECHAGCKAKPGETQTQFEKAFRNSIFSSEVRHLLNPHPRGRQQCCALPLRLLDSFGSGPVRRDPPPGRSPQER